MKITKKLGMILLASWLIVTGILQLVSFAIPGMLMAIIAIAAGILILISK